MFALISSLLIYTENGHQYETNEKKKLNLVLQGTTEIEIPATVEHIKAGSASLSAFCVCADTIRIVHFEGKSNLKSFGKSLFENTAIEEIDFTNCANLLNMSDSCFKNTKKLRVLKLPPNLEAIPAGFLYASGIKEIVIPNSVTEIKDWTSESEMAFGYSSIAKVIINKESSLTKIGYLSFHNCLSLNEFFIPRKVNTIGIAAFCRCPINKFTIDSLNTVYSTDGKTIYNKNGDRIILISGIDFGEEYLINSNIVELSSQCFRGVTAKRVVFTKQNIVINSYAFFNSYIVEITYPSEQTEVVDFFAAASTYLKKVTISGSIKTIKTNAFQGCSNLSSVTLSNQLETIEGLAFQGCTSLSYLLIPKSVVTVNSGAFAACNSNIKFDFENKTRFTFSDGCLYCDSTFVDYIQDSDDKDIIIPKNIECISTGMFKSKKLNSLSFEEGSVIKELSSESFIYSTIRSITFAPSITYIGNRVFYKCKRLETVKFDGTLENINIDAFYNCTNLLTVIFNNENSIKTISKRAFYNCENMKTFEIEKLTHLTTIDESAFEMAYFKPFVFPSSLTDLKSRAFYKSSIKSVSFNDDCNITSISSYCFFGCEKLTSIKFSSLTKSIDIYAFSGCSLLETVTLGTGIEIINQYAFYESTHLNKIVIPSGSKLQRIMGFAFGRTQLATFDVKGSEFFFKEGLLLNRDKTILIYFIPNENVNMITLPGSVSSIGDYAFQHATHLNEVFIPEGSFNRIGFSSFEGCTNLKRVSLPSSLTFIDKNAFLGCNKILCGGLFINDAMVNDAKKAGIQDMPLSDQCRNNYKMLRRNIPTCRRTNQLRSVSISLLFVLLMA